MAVVPCQQWFVTALGAVVTIVSHMAMAAGPGTLPLVYAPTTGTATTAFPVGESLGTDTITFIDQEGDVSTLTFSSNGYLIWCASFGDFGCHNLREVRLELRGPCRFQLRGHSWSSAIAKPAPGLEQWKLAGRLLRTAKQYGVLVSGSGVAELEAWPLDDTVAAVLDDAELLDFPLPADNSKHHSAFLRIPGDWRNKGDGNASAAQWPCMAVVRRPEDCNVCTFFAAADAACATQPLWSRGGLDKQLTFEVPLPDFALPAAASALWAQDGARASVGRPVCMRSAAPSSLESPTRSALRIVGRLRYFIPPEVRFEDDLVRIGVRTFLNPGWHRKFRLGCRNCSAANRIAIRPILTDINCRGLLQQTIAIAVAAVKDGQVPAKVHIRPHNALGSKLMDVVRQKGGVGHIPSGFCKAPKHGPCSGYADENSFSVGAPATESDVGEADISFMVEGRERLLAVDRKMLFHHRSAICFFPNADAPIGWLVGFALVHIDGPDMQAFVAFVCFFGVALPLICLITVLSHYNKHERCRQHVQQLRLEYQREQLGREMEVRRTSARDNSGSVGRSQTAALSSSSIVPPAISPQWLLAAAGVVV